MRFSLFLKSSLLLTVLLFAIPALAADEGILDVKANVDGALVFIDGELVGETPFLELVPAGRHTIRVERDAFVPYEEAHDLAADQTLELSVKLVRSAPGLEIRVDVDDATVFLDGQQVGTGRLVVVDPVTPGTHELRVKTPEYDDWSGKVTLKPGTMTPVEVSLRGSLGMLIVEAEPPARVLLDGRDYGTTPVTIDPVQPGAHGLKLTADGLSTILQAVVIEPGKTANVAVTMVEEGGTLDVKPNVSGARVFVNGVEVGKGKVEVGPLKPGIYSLRVTAPGHADFLQPAEVIASKSVNVVARLEAFDYDGGRLAGGPPVPVHKHPGFWVGIGAGAAAVAGAVIAGVVVSQQDTGGGDPPQPRPGVDPPAGASVVYTLP